MTLYKIDHLTDQHGGEQTLVVEADNVLISSDTGATELWNGGVLVAAVLTKSLISIQSVDVDQALRFVLAPISETSPDYTFVEVETDGGSSVKLGEWVEHPAPDSALTTIRFTVADMVKALASGNAPTP